MCDMSVCCIVFWELSWHPVHFKLNPTCWLTHGTMINYFLMMPMRQQHTMNNWMYRNLHQIMMVMMAMLRGLLMLMLIAMNRKLVAAQAQKLFVDFCYNGLVMATSTLDAPKVFQELAILTQQRPNYVFFSNLYP